MRIANIMVTDERCVKVGERPDTFLNHNCPKGVNAMAVKIPIVEIARILAKRLRCVFPPGFPARDTTTSLNASPNPLVKNTKP